MAKRKKLKSGDPGWYVREWLVFKGLRQKDLVSRTDWNKSQVNEWVNGSERWNRDVLHAFAHAIGVEPADLLRPPPINPVDDEFSRFVVQLDQRGKERALRLLRAAGLGDGDAPERAA
jgi:transcriptional regulator with XRE-family HTH domain